VGVAAAGAAAQASFESDLMRIARTVCLCAIAAMAIVGGRLPSPAIAQDIPALTPDRPVSGQLSADTFRQLYTFDAAQGATIGLTMTVTAGTLDPQLILTDPQGAVLQRSLGSGTTKGTAVTASLQASGLPVSGTYFVIVTRFGQDRGTTTGSYTLQLTASGGSIVPATAATSGTISPADSTVPTAAPTSTPLPAITPIAYGDQTIGEIGTDASRLYQFQAQRGDRITIAMQRIANNLDPYLILRDPAGKSLIGQDDDPLSPGTLDAAIRNWLITTSGTYQIVATRFGQAAGTSHGSYALSLSKLAADQLGLSAATAALLDPGAPVAGSIDATTPARYYQISGQTGALIGLDALRTRGNLNPALTLTDLAGKPIPKASYTAQIGQRATLTPFVLPATSDYLVVVSYAPSVITAGGFVLTLTTWQGVAVNASGDLTIKVGTPVLSILSNAESSHEYLFSGKAGAIVTINMAATSGDLLPSLILETDARRLLAYNDPGQAGQAAQLKLFTLPADGVYRIIATRHGRAGGATTGLYTLMVSQ